MVISLEKSLKESMSKNKIIYDAEQEMSASDYLVAFSGLSESYCVGLVDMADSTRISANMNEKEWCRYYEIFLNSMAKLLPRFGGIAIKNLGDSLLYYFPESSNQHSKFGFVCCIECSLRMVEAHELVCSKLNLENLPCLNYRVSADFGKVVMMKSNNSHANDLIGPPVNMCSKINHRAENNGVVIGGDLYQAVKDLDEYNFKPERGFSIGLKYADPIYSVSRKK